MGRLDRHTVYLSGPMDDVADGGVEWRQWIEPILRSRFGLGILNPCDKPIPGALEDDENRDHIRHLKKEGKYEEVQEVAELMVDTDLTMTRRADFLILYIDRDAHMCGSYLEAGWALAEKKPILVVCKQGIAEIPNFLWGYKHIPAREMFFGNFDDLLKYLNLVDSGTVPMKCWTFFDMDKVHEGPTLQTAL